jgi:hypothetical protein
MGTRSTIAYKEGNTIRAVYCHWDGYTSHNGRILQNFYQEARKIGQLIELGDMSSLGAQLGEKHPFDERVDADTYADTRCTFYGRDRGEDGVDAKEFDTIQAWLEHYDWSDYAYLWNGREWLVHNTYTGKDANDFPVFDRLEDVLEREGALEA